MAKRAVCFNYKKDTQHAWLYCIATILILLFLNVATYFALKVYRPAISKKPTLALAIFFGINTSKSLLPGIPVTAYLFLVYNLHKRFAALNLFLRYKN